MIREIEELQKIIDTHKKIVFFGGAGVSTESGIPDFRSQDGLYNLKYKYPPEGMDDAVQTVITQCELWTDNNDMDDDTNFKGTKLYSFADSNERLYRVAEEREPYGKKD